MLSRFGSHKKSIKSILSLAGGNLSAAVLGAVGGILVARFVSPEVNGQFRLFTIPLMYLTFLHFGTFDGLNRQIPFYLGKDCPERVSRIAAAAGSWNVLVTCLVAAGFSLCALWALAHGDSPAAVGWLSQAVAAVGIYYGGYLGATYRTLDHFVVLAKIQMIQALLAFCLVATVALWGFYGLCLRVAIPGLVGAWLFHRARPLKMPLDFEMDSFKEVVRIGLPLCFWGTLSTSLWVAAEYSLMLYFGGVTAVGLFSVAFILREGLAVLPQAVHQVLMPRAVESFSRDGGVADAARRNGKVAGLLALLMTAVVLLVWLFLDYFVPLFIPNYIDGLTLMKVCLVAVIIQAMGIPLSSLTATGRGWLVGKGVLTGLLAFPVAVYLLNPYIGGMLAVAAGSLIGRLVRTAVAYGDLFMLVKQEAC